MVRGVSRAVGKERTVFWEVIEVDLRGALAVRPGREWDQAEQCDSEEWPERPLRPRGNRSCRVHEKKSSTNVESVHLVESVATPCWKLGIQVGEEGGASWAHRLQAPRLVVEEPQRKVGLMPTLLTRDRDGREGVGHDRTSLARMR